MSQLLTTLNDQQREAVLKTEGPLLILAGAGTGKTMTVTSRIAYILEKKLARSEQILAVTFTNRAAGEMRERIDRLAGSKSRGIWCSTFHSFCMRLLRLYCRKLGYTPQFTLADPSEQEGMVRQIMPKAGYVEGETVQTAQDLLMRISRLKGDNILPEDLAESKDLETRRLAHVYGLYQETLHAMNIMDFDDLLQQAVLLLANHADVRAAIRQRFLYIMVDEFQDTNAIQMELLRQVCGTSNPNLCVVGDDDQSIYSWRGAIVENILRFDQQFPGAHLIKLEQNYRSTAIILDAANHLISYNAQRLDKKLRSDVMDGEKIRIVRCESAEKEAEAIATSVVDAVRRRQFKFSEMAVLYRSNHQSQLIESELHRRGVPVHLVGDKSFMERKEVKDAVSFMEAAVNTKNDFAWLRVINLPSRGFGPASLKNLRMEAERRRIGISEMVKNQEFMFSLGQGGRNVYAFAEQMRKHAIRLDLVKGKALADEVESFLTDIGYLNGLMLIYRNRTDAEARRENVLEMVHAIRRMAERRGEEFSVSDYLESFALQEEMRRRNEQEDEHDAVTLMTVHASKGLEYGDVYVCGMEMNLFPHEKSTGLKQLPEERRLFYVAVTRAKKRLTLTWAGQRTIRRERKARQRSQFLRELPKESIEECSPRELVQTLSKKDVESEKAKILAALMGKDI